MFTLLLQCRVNDGNRRCVRGVSVYPLTKEHALSMVYCSQSRLTASRLLHHHRIRQPTTTTTTTSSSLSQQHSQRRGLNHTTALQHTVLHSLTMQMMLD